MLLEVTNEDIQEATRSLNNCLIARDTKRVCDGMVIVGTDYIYVEKGGRRRTFRLPAIARELVRSFDRGEEVLPLIFEAEEFMV
jgi:hypothetical protein